MLVSLDKEKYSLVLEYADCGTLGKYLRDDTMTFNWENQLRLQVRFYGYMMLRESVHEDLVSKIFCVILLYYVINIFFF